MESEEKKDDGISIDVASNLNKEIGLSAKSAEILEVPRKKYRRTHEEIEDFVVKRQRKAIGGGEDDNSGILKRHSSNNKTDISSSEKQQNSNGYDPRQRNGNFEAYTKFEIHRQGDPRDERRYDYFYGDHHDMIGFYDKRQIQEENSLSRVNFIPGSSKSTLVQHERSKNEYHQQSFSPASLSVNGDPSDLNKEIHFERRSNKMELEDGRGNSAREHLPIDEAASKLDRFRYHQSSNISRTINIGLTNKTNSHKAFQGNHISSSSMDINAPFNLQKSLITSPEGGSNQAMASSSATLTAIRPHSSRKPSPATAVSSSASPVMLVATSFGINGSSSTSTNPSSSNVDVKDVQSSSGEVSAEGISHSDQSIINYLSRVRRNNDIIITSVPRSPNSPNSSLKEEFEDSRQHVHHQRQRLQISQQKSSNDRRLPQAKFSDTIATISISKVPSLSPSNVTQRGELLISPAPDDSFSPLDPKGSKENDDTRDSTHVYVLPLSPSASSDSAVPRKPPSDSLQYRKDFSPHKTLNMPTYILSNQHREPSPPSTRIPLSLSDRLDSDCSRLLSSKRDLIVERVIQPEREKLSDFPSSYSPDERSTDQEARYHLNIDSKRHTGPTLMDANTGAITNNPVSVAGHLRLRDFSKSLATTNDVKLSNSPNLATIAMTKLSTAGNTVKGQHRTEDPGEKLLSLTSSRVMERFDKHSERNEWLNEKTEDKSLMKTPCEYCDHVFMNEADLNDHIGRFHAGVKKFVCFVCHKRFKRKQSLENHVLMIHGSGSATTAASGGGAGVVTDSHEVGNYNGNSIPGRHVDLTNAREQMIMLMMKRKLEFSAIASRANNEQQQQKENSGDACGS